MYIELLKKVLEDKENREKLISEFQKFVWESQYANEIYRELAYDLDFYEPNDLYRTESTSYYDDQRLEQLINTALEKSADEFGKSSEDF